MATRRTTAISSNPVKETAAKQQSRFPLFEKDNFLWMGIGAAIVALGMFLMSGGKNQDPNQFDYKLVYSTTRITIATVIFKWGWREFSSPFLFPVDKPDLDFS